MIGKYLKKWKQMSSRIKNRLYKATFVQKMRIIKNAFVYKRLYEEKVEQLEFFKEHVDICDIKPAKGELRGLQKELSNFLVEVTQMLEQIGIYPFLVAGTLIGALRHQGFIPWDDDLDLGITREEYCQIIAFAKRNWIVEVYDGKWSQYTATRHLDRIDRCCKEHPNQWILDIWVDQLQIFKGTSVTNRLSVDLWPFDSFPKNYCPEVHFQYIRDLQRQWREIDYVDKAHDFLMEQIEKNPFIGGGELYYFGIESQPAIHKENTSLIPKDIIFPLRKINFEGHKFWAPQNASEYISYEYKNYMSFPEDIGIKKHRYYDEYVEKNLIGVDFYLVDSFEIEHFLPFYYEFKKKGANVAFVCEPPQCGGSDWLDYDEAQKKLLKLEVKFRKNIHTQAALAFTTQDAHHLSRYRGMKIFVSYGAGLYQKGFGYTSRVTSGFDYCLVNGPFMKSVFSKSKSEDRILIMGAPKHKRFEKNQCQRHDVYEELHIHPDKPVILYFPTWDENSSIQAYAETFRELKKEYYIITKAHHCTWRLKQKREDLETLYKISDLVLSGSYDLEKSAVLGDIAVCDAKSAVSTELAYLNPHLRLVLISMVNDYHKYYVEEIDQLGIVVSSPIELISAIKSGDPAFQEQYRMRKILNQKFYGENSQNYVEEIVNTLLERAGQKG